MMSQQIAIVLALMVCASGVVATVGAFWQAGQRSYGGWHLLAAWDSSPYVALASCCLLFSRRFASALAMLLGSFGITAFGCLVVWAALQPPPSPGPTNCAGPVVELLLPLVQAVAILTLSIFALLINHCWPRSHAGH